MGIHPLHTFWALILTLLKEMMVRAAFDRWLNGSEARSLKGTVLRVAVRDQYAVDWLTGRWQNRIDQTVADYATEFYPNGIKSVEFVTKEVSNG